MENCHAKLTTQSTYLLSLERGRGEILAKTYEYRRKEASYVISKLDLRLVVFTRDNFTCRNPLANPTCTVSKNLSVDHIVPVAKGGTDDLENLQTLCLACNSKKGARL